MKSRKIIVILLILNMIMAIIISNLLINRGIKVEKQTIKEMTEGEYESKITELNTSHEEYNFKVQENKKKLATAITNQKVTTSENASIDDIVTNIGKILQVGTSDATATAEDIVEGKTAYVNGSLVTGLLKQSTGAKIIDSYYTTTNNSSTSAPSISVSRDITLNESGTYYVVALITGAATQGSRGKLLINRDVTVKSGTATIVQDTSNPSLYTVTVTDNCVLTVSGSCSGTSGGYDIFGCAEILCFS